MAGHRRPLKTSVLIDAALTTEDAEQIVRWIEAIGKNLTTIYITHGHGDHIGLNGIHLWLAFTDRWPAAIRPRSWWTR